MKPLLPRSAKLYARLISRAFNGTEPSYAPKVDDWPESVRVPLRAAIQRYWLDRGQRDKGKAIAGQIPAARRLKRKKLRPTAADEVAFEKQLRKEEPRVRSLLRVGLGLGLRSEELLTLPRAQFEAGLKWGQIKIQGKGFKERTLSTAGVKEALQEMLHEPAFIAGAVRWGAPGQLVSSQGASFSSQRNMLTWHIKRVARAAGLNPDIWTPHTLRHVFATRMFRDGAPVQVIQEALGHEDVQTTVKYIGVTTEDVAKYMRKIR